MEIDGVTHHIPPEVPFRDHTLTLECPCRPYTGTHMDKGGEYILHRAR